MKTMPTNNAAPYIITNNQKIDNGIYKIKSTQNIRLDDDISRERGSLQQGIP